MKSISERLGEWATNFKGNQFAAARIKLTAYYALGILVILLISDAAVYAMFSNNLADRLRFERQEAVRSEELTINGQSVEDIFASRAVSRLEEVLLLTDALVFIFIVGAGYYLSGKTLQPIGAALDRQRKFNADAAHELRTPLTVMKTGIETTLEKKVSAEEYRSILSDALAEVNSLISISNDLLFLAKQTGGLAKNFEKVELSRLVKKEESLMRPYAEEKEVELKTEAEGEVFVNGNANDLLRLLSNLAKNAVDYNRRGGLVEIKLSRHGKQAALSVSDTGVGISEKDLPHIFDRFYRRAGQEGGSGLGLAIAKEIVQAHGGQIKAESRIGEGSVFTVYLPLA